MSVRPLLLLLAISGCTKTAPSGSFQDDFNRSALGPDWQTENPGAYRLVDGQLEIRMAHNQPLWLTRPIPRDVRIDFDCTPREPAVDMKVEVFGDGRRHESAEDIARDAQYTASGYVFIFGGWHNQLSTLARQFEHQWQYQPGVPMRRDVRGVPNRRYHWTIIRDGHHLEWDLDGSLFLQLDDPNPLEGPGHDRFAFDGWESEVACDDLKIEPLR